jgi:hypothetical protein
MDIFNEILWPQFTQIGHIRKLPINEQVEAYNQYLYDLSIARMNWLAMQPKGQVASTPETTPEVEMVTQDGFVLITESGDDIILQ